MAWFLVLFALSSLSASLAKHKASDYFNICHQNDPNRDDCIKKSIIQAKVELIKGIPDLEVPPIDPLVIPKLEMNQGQGNFKLHFKLTNFVMRGMKAFELRDVRVANDWSTLNMTLFTPKLDMEADYEIDGKILVIPIKGSGQVTFNFTGIETKAFITYEKYQKGGKEFMRINNFKWKIDPQDGKSYFSNLFNGDKALGDATNRVLNENSKSAYEAYRQLPEEAFGELFKELSNRLLTRFPYEEWVLS